MTAPVSLGFTTASSGVSIGLSPSAGVSTGQTIIAFVSLAVSAASSPTVTDTQGNSYTLLAIIRSGNTSALAFASTLAVGLAVTDTVTYSNATSNGMGIELVTCPGYTTVDAGVTQTAGGTTSAYTLTSGVPLVTGEMMIGFIHPYQHAANSASGWTTILSSTAPDLGSFYTAYQIAGSSALTFAGTLSTLAQWTALVIGIEPNANPFIPNPMSKMMTLQQRPHNIGLSPTEEQGARITVPPLTLTSVLGGASQFGTVATGDLVMEDAEGVINNVQTMFVDASKMAYPMRLFFPETQQTLFIPARCQGYLPIAVSGQGQVQATAFDLAGTDSANVSIVIQFLNVPVAGILWTATGV